MTVQSFTPSGVTAKKAELDALSDTLLLTQANLIRSDLISWVEDNFSLDTAQQTYLTGIDSRFIALAASLTGYAVENRIPVTLTVLGNSSDDLKLIHVSNDLELVTAPGSGISNSGGVYYTIEYRAS